MRGLPGTARDSEGQRGIAQVRAVEGLRLIY